MHARRYGLAAIAIVACAWFVIGARQAHDLTAATTRLDQQAGNSATATRQTRSLLSSADFLYPGVDVTLLRARLDMEQHNFTQAKGLVDSALASEPQNLNVWISALDLSIGDPSLEKPSLVVAHLRVLDPIDVRTLIKR